MGITLQSLSQRITSYAPQGACTGCVNNPNSNITLSTSNSTVCYSGTGTISTLAINNSNITVYICGNITITNVSYNWQASGSSIVVNSGKTLTLSNPPPSNNLYLIPSLINYGTMNITIPAGWTLDNGHIITANSSAVTNINGNMYVNGGTVQIDGGILNVTGLTTLNNGGAYLSSNGIFQSKDLLTTNDNMLTVSPSSLGCMFFSGTATLYHQLTNSILNVVKGAGTTVTGSGGWGPHATVSSGNATSCTVLLPMVMNDFSINNSETKVIVNWSTFSEQNSNHFEIERSNDGTNFSTIGTVSASGNSASTKQYSFTDFYPITGNDFYRIKLLADDGNPSFSVIKQIEIKSPAAMKVTVNNSQNNVKIIMPEHTAQSTLRLLDMQGRILKTVKQTGQEELVMIETSNILSGIYIVELLSQNSHQSKQIFISSGK